MQTSRLDPDGASSNLGYLAATELVGQPVAADAAHELANLMTVVLGSLEQLRSQPLDPPGRQQLGRAEWGARQAARLTRQVLSRTQGRDERPGITDLNEVVGGFAAVLGRRLECGALVAVELASARLPVRLDAGLLELVLLNLARNAADAMPSGGEVIIRTQGPRLAGMGDRLTVEVSVSDTGTGMAPAVARRAMEAFFTTKAHGRGTGLGLWMAERFARACEGKVVITTEEGQGTVVRLVFPYAADEGPG